MTDHKALVSLLNDNNKKNKTIFSRLTRWLDRFIPFAFQVEHKPGAKYGRADYLSRNPSKEATPISTYDKILTVAKINLIVPLLGLVKVLHPADPIHAIIYPRDSISKRKVNNV